MATNWWCKKQRIGFFKLNAVVYEDRGLFTRQSRIASIKFNIASKRYKKSKVNYHLFTNFNISGSIAI